MKRPVLVIVLVLLFAAVLSVTWAPPWEFGSNAFDGQVELDGMVGHPAGLIGGVFSGLFGAMAGIVTAVLAVIGVILAVLIAVPMALLAGVAAMLLAVVIVLAVLLGLASPLLLPIVLVLAVVWLARRSGPRPPVPVRPAGLTRQGSLEIPS